MGKNKKINDAILLHWRVDRSGKGYRSIDYVYISHLDNLEGQEETYAAEKTKVTTIVVNALICC